MLNAHRMQPFKVFFKGISVNILRTDSDIFSASYVGIYARNGQTSLLVFLLAGAAQYLRVDIHARLVLIFADIQHQQAFVDIYLGCSETNSTC